MEPNPGPTSCPICNKEFVEGKEAAVWCHLGGWVHLKCTHLKRIKRWDTDFLCRKCELLTRAMSPAEDPTPDPETRDEKKQRRQNEKAERRRRRKDLRNKKWETRDSLKGRATVTEIWAWNIQRARVAFSKRNMLTEMKETETGMKWIKSQDLYGVLVHGKKSGVLLRDDWAVKWKEQGCKRYCGERCTSVEVDGTVFIAVYQPLWNSDKVEFAEYREELNGLILKCKQQTKLIFGGDLNSSVGNDTKREKDEVAGPFGLGPTNSAGEDLINWCHEQCLSFVNSFFKHKRRGTWKCPARGTWHELDGFLVKQQQKSRLVKNVWTTSTRKFLTDHKPKVMSCWLDKEKTRKHKPPTPKINWDNLRQGETKKMFQEKVDEKISEWPQLMKVIYNTGKEICGKKKRNPLSPWLDEHISEIEDHQKKIINLTAAIQRAPAEDSATRNLRNSGRMNGGCNASTKPRRQRDTVTPAPCIKPCDR